VDKDTDFFWKNCQFNY